MARVNEVLREVLAEEIELVAAADSRLELVTVTAVACEPDLRHAKVLLASLPDAALAALGEARPRLQKAVAHQAKLKRTPSAELRSRPSDRSLGPRSRKSCRAIQLEDEARGPAPGGEQEPPE